MCCRRIRERIWTFCEFIRGDPLTKVQIEAIAISIPIDQPTRMSTRVLGARDYVIVRATNDGCPEAGLGYVYAGTNGGRVLAAFVRECLAPLLEKLEQVDPVSVWEAMFQETLLLGRRGLAIRAMSAIDIALWDLAAKVTALPLAKMLGGSVKLIPAYASGGYYRLGFSDYPRDQDEPRTRIQRPQDKGRRALHRGGFQSRKGSGKCDGRSGPASTGCKQRV